MISDYWANILLDASLKNVAVPALSTIYVALLQAIPIRQTQPPGSECSAGNYARIAVANANWSSAADQKSKNTSAVTFAAPNADWAPAATPVIAIALMDASSTGHWMFATPVCPFIIKTGDPAPSFAIGGILAAFSSCFP